MTVNLPVAGKLRRDEWGVPLTQQCNDHDTRIDAAEVLLDAVRVTAVGAYSGSGTDPQEHVKIRSASIPIANGRAYRFSGQLLVTYSVSTDVWILEVHKGSTGGTIVGGGQIDAGAIWTWDFVWPAAADETTQFYYVLNRVAGAGTITLWGFSSNVWNTVAQIFELGSGSLVRDVP